MGILIKGVRGLAKALAYTGGMVTMTNLGCKAKGVKINTTARNVVCGVVGIIAAVADEYGRDCKCKSCDKKEEQPEPETEE